MIGRHILRAAIVVVIAVGLAGCGKLDCGSAEVKALVEGEAAQLTSFLGVYKALNPDLQFKTEVTDYVTEESDARHAICRATITSLMGQSGELKPISSAPSRFRVDRTSEGRLVIVELNEGRR